MKKKKYSIKGIAESLGVSITTVSFVINGKAKEKRISDEVANRILDYIELIGYKPNQLAQSLRTGKSNVIVCMVEDLANSFFSKLARLIEGIAYEEGYRVLFCSNENDDKKSTELINLFKERQVDGYIIIPSPGISDQIEQLQKEEFPVVLCDRYFPGIEVSYVVIDNEAAAYKGTKHLIKNKFKNIAFISTDVTQMQMIGRESGYLMALREEGLKECILNLSNKEKENLDLGKARIEFFLKDHPELDAIFFATNYLTSTALSVIKNSFPGSIDSWGLLTFDDNDYFTIHTPTISVVDQPLEAMAQEAMQTMFELLRKSSSKKIPIRKVILSAELIERESSQMKKKSKI